MNRRTGGNRTSSPCPRQCKACPLLGVAWRRWLVLSPCFFSCLWAVGLIHSYHEKTPANCQTSGYTVITEDFRCWRATSVNIVGRPRELNLGVSRSLVHIMLQYYNHWTYCRRELEIVTDMWDHIDIYRLGVLYPIGPSLPRQESDSHPLRTERHVKLLSGGLFSKEHGRPNHIRFWWHVLFYPASSRCHGPISHPTKHSLKYRTPKSMVDYHVIPVLQSYCYVWV